MSIKLEDRAFRAALNRLAAGMDDMTDPMNDIGEFLVVTTKRRFAAGTDPDGSPWAANSPVTLARKRDPRPLFGPSGQLNQQIFHETGPRQVEIGSPMVYAAMQQFGGAKAAFPHLWGDIPARPFIGLSEEDGTGILDIVTEWLEGLAGAP